MVFYGAAVSTAGEDMALSMQSDHYFAVYGVCESPADDKRCKIGFGM